MSLIWRLFAWILVWSIFGPQIKLISMMFGFAEIFRAPVGQNTEQGDLFFCEERQGYTVEGT